MGKIDTGKRFYDARTKLNKNNIEREKPESIRSVYKQTGVSASSILKYENGVTLPNMKQAQKLAEYYGVNVLWLLGKSDSYSLDENNQIVSNITGLSANVIDWLCGLDSDKMSCLNDLLSSNSFHNALSMLNTAKIISKRNENFIIPDTNDPSAPQSADEMSDLIETSNLFEIHYDHTNDEKAWYKVGNGTNVSNRQLIKMYRTEALQDMGNAFRSVAPADESEKGVK